VCVCVCVIPFAGSLWDLCQQNVIKKRRNFSVKLS